MLSKGFGVITGFLLFLGLTISSQSARAASTNICSRTNEVQVALEKAMKLPCARIQEAELKSFKGDIELVDISSLKSDDFAGLSSLNSIFIHDSPRLTTLPARLLQGLTSLYGILVRNTGLTHLPPGLFQDLPLLENIELSNNQLVTLPEGLFVNLPALEELFLDMNKFSALPDGVFRGLTRVGVIGLGAEKLSSLPPSIFRGLVSLQNIMLNSNQIVTLPDQVFRGLPKLHGIYLENNRIADINKDVFAEVTQPQRDYEAHLYVTGCPLSPETMGLLSRQFGNRFHF